MLNRPQLCALPYVLVVAACGAAPSSSPTSATTAGGGTAANAASASGAVEGHTLAPKSAVFASSSSDGTSLYVVLSSQPAYCANLTAGKTQPQHISLVLGLFSQAADGTSLPVSTGTYSVVTAAPTAAGNYSVAQFNASDANCNSALTNADGGAASAGTVKLHANTATDVSGSFSVTVEGSALEGEFQAVECAGLATQLSSQAALTCSK